VAVTTRDTYPEGLTVGAAVCMARRMLPEIATTRIGLLLSTKVKHAEPSVYSSVYHIFARISARRAARS
jgi:hypothetical protein